MDSELVDAIVGPVLTAVLAGIAVLLREWRLSRRWEQQRDRILAQGRADVGYINEWLAAHSQIAAADPQADAGTTRALRDLERSYAAVSRQIAVAEAAKPDSGRSAQERLQSLLLRRVTRGRAKVVRFAYYLALVWVLFAASVALPNSLRGKEGEYSALTSAVLTVIVTALFALPAFLLHGLVRRLDRPVSTPGAPVEQVAVAVPPGVPAHSSQPG